MLWLFFILGFVIGMTVMFFVMIVAYTVGDARHSRRPGYLYKEKR